MSSDTNQSAADPWNDIAVVNEKLLRPGISLQESQDLYNMWARMGTYDKLYLSAEAKYYTAHDQLMTGVLSIFPHNRDIRVLDVGAGTGLIGERLRDHGFKNVDALDASVEMLKAAERKGVYQRYLQGVFTQDPIDGIDNDTYDLIVMCGVCGPGAVPVEAFEEAVRILKPNGYVVNCMRAEYLETCPEYRGRWQPFVARLEEEGKWRLVSQHKYSNHYFNHDGLLIIHQIF
nr:hypothetical protein BaRGS_030854 [Batillaria attramentaria]